MNFIVPRLRILIFFPVSVNFSKCRMMEKKKRSVKRNLVEETKFVENKRNRAIKVCLPLYILLQKIVLVSSL